MLRFFAKGLSALHKTERDERGFTLIELLIVVIIIGILAAIAIPTFLAQRSKAQIATCRSDTRNAAEAATLYAADNDPLNNYAGLTVNGGAPDMVSEGFNQTIGYTTTIVNPPVPGNDFEIQTVCAGGVGTTHFTTVAGPNAGQVTGP